MKGFFIFSILTVLFSAPPIDPWIDHSMAAQMVIEIPVLILLGWLSGSKVAPSLTIPWSAGTLVLCVGLVSFWMIPRSLDLAVSQPMVDLLMHFCLWVAGFGFAASLPRLGVITQTAIGIYGVAMWATFALVLSQTAAQICAWFSLEQQKFAGESMLWFAGLFLVFHLVNSIRLLVRPADPLVE